MSVLVGGVSQLFQGDLDVGRRAVDRLGDEVLGPGVRVEDLHYGAITVAQRLEELEPRALVLIGAETRDRPPGTLERRRITGFDHLDTTQLQAAVGDAYTGYVTIDLLLEVAWALGFLPRRTVSIEIEPVSVDPSEQLTSRVDAAIEPALELVRAEVRRIPLLECADEIRVSLADGHLEPSPTLAAIEDLLGELTLLDQEGRWGRTFAERDRLRLRIATGESSQGMSHVDWGLWWALIEELDRIQAVEGDLDLH